MNNNAVNAAEMPRYQSHKKVWALKIAAIEIDEDKSATIAPADHGYAAFTTMPGWADRWKGSEEDLGYYVVYADGYSSWSPTKAFEEGYTPAKAHIEGESNSGQRGIGWAIKQMHNGAKVARAGWNGKGMFLILVPGSTFKVNRPPLLGVFSEGTEVQYHPHVDLKNADGVIVPWNASQGDLLATDWQLVS
jgi:hypothetical protein